MEQKKFDPRIIQVAIEVNGRLNTYQNLYIQATGTKYANANQNECEIKIGNLNQETRNAILTETSPFNKNNTQKTVIVSAGRESYGVFKIFSGNVVSATSGQKPDIFINLKCLTGNYAKGNLVSKTAPSNISLAELSQEVATSLGLTLKYQASEKTISNYNFTGGALKQVDDLNTTGNIDAYIDNDILVVKDARVPLKNTIVSINSGTGMIGIPELTEQGVRVTFLLTPAAVLGGLIRVTSKLNPATNGDYAIYKLGFELSNREVPFYYTADGLRI